MLLDLLPELADIDPQILRVLGMSRSPNRRENLPVRHDPPGMLRQKRQELQFFGRQLQLGAAARDAMANGIDFQPATFRTGTSTLRCIR